MISGWPLRGWRGGRVRAVGKTASGATAVQIVHKRGRRVLGIDHIGSAHTGDQAPPRTGVSIEVGGGGHPSGSPPATFLRSTASGRSIAAQAPVTISSAGESAMKPT